MTGLVETFILWLQHLDPLLVYAVVFSIAFVENIFPPSPSDLVIVFAGSLAGLGEVTFAGILLLATAGSTVGFVTMYKIGDWFGDRILEQGKVKFIPVAAVNRVEEWFGKYGYWIIVVNRFLAGTRAVVSFFAGMAELHLGRTAMLSALSALAWNAILVSSGYALGKNWEQIGFYLTTYGQIVTALVVLGVLLLVVKFLYARANGKGRS